ncbi:EscS/YscS/HrcS family type III secretion system export apparatus protein [Labrys portucalensis]|jgi:type III secretion protein S|uniref:EscS/YscS/HrcS family type III secretion system export apparatus protein n=2 Tax=Labrys TaxID=204476 RepID=A0ABV3PV68_9HYPH|nr:MULTISPECIES: flagellar biosynthetic protein FliQ [Labrys]MDT3378211.1 flagellar biosynthetic protein FliQ [Labrys neptuniae]MDZ5453363.1 flagellar biosynthetic protein FliQ [Labrys sp. ZIDIC5]OCC06718.1 EscS/YscS/HrcS family type III secretion system export apparatus protein [Labrys sp. WJW]QEN85325.1 flagellar biosynthetic protein FliQ [Labrys sp. KNU-23]
MANDFILAKVQSALWMVLILSGPAIVAALVVGLLIGFAQALTQIQDQSLPQTVKLVVVLVVILLVGPLLGYQIANEASKVMDEFPVVTRQ